MNSKEREDKKEIKVIKEMEDWGRHFDILLWTVTAIMATAIGGLLVCTINKFDMGLAIAGFFLTIITVYFAASFREVRHKIGKYYSVELKEVLRSRKLSQWGAYRLIFVILAILYTKLLIENSTNFWLIGLWFIMGSIGTVKIILLKYREENEMEFKEPIQPKDSGYRELERPEIWGQLTNAINLGTREDQVLWSIFGVFWGANAILLVALFTTGSLPSPAVGIVVSAAGVSLSLTWHIIQRRALGHLERFEELIRKLEEKLGFHPDYAISVKINKKDYAQFLGKHPGLARALMEGCSLVGTGLWALGFIIFLLKLR